MELVADGAAAKARTNAERSAVTAETGVVRVCVGDDSNESRREDERGEEHARESITAVFAAHLAKQPAPRRQEALRAGNHQLSVLPVEFLHLTRKTRPIETHLAPAHDDLILGLVNGNGLTARLASRAATTCDPNHEGRREPAPVFAAAAALPPAHPRYWCIAETERQNEISHILATPR